MGQVDRVLMAGIMSVVGLTDSVPLVGREPRKPHWKATQSDEDRTKRREAAEAKRIRKDIKRGKRDKNEVLEFIVAQSGGILADAVYRASTVGISEAEVFAWFIGNTSWSVDEQTNVSSWKYAKLAEDEDENNI